MLSFYPFKKDGPLMGIVIESKLEKNSGPKATVIVKNGVLKLRDEIFAENAKGKVKSFDINDYHHLITWAMKEKSSRK